MLEIFPGKTVPLLVRKCRPRLLQNRLSPSVSAMSTASSSIPTPSRTTQNRIQVGDTYINFATVGNGPHAVLCLPGIFGTIETDFEPIFHLMDPRKFSLVCWDPPGYGKSRPPERETIYHGNPFANETDLATDLMRILDIPKYSILGWGHGGITGAHIAATYRKRVEKFICWGSCARIDEKSLTTATSRTTNDLQDLPPRWEALLEIYGEETATQLLAQWRAYAEKCVNFGFFRLDLLLPAIKAPTLILHGRKDNICCEEDAKIYAKLIPQSRLETWEDADHSLHLEHPDKFVQRIEQFLLEGL